MRINRINTARITITLLLSTLFLTFTTALGIGNAQQPAIEQIQASAGEVIEVLGVSDLPSASFTWVLLKDSMFLEAGREKVFRFRPIESGLYQLDAEATALDGSAVQRRTIILSVQAQGTIAPIPATENSLVATDPALQNGTIAIPPQKSVVRVIPNVGDAIALQLDLDVSKDTNGDGNAQNDNDTDGTYFSSNETPLLLWFASQPERTMQLNITSRDGRAVSQQINVSQRMLPPPPPPTSETISAAPDPSGALRFSVSVPGIDTNTTPLHYQWSFGDGTESLLSEPQHLYKQSGTYTVRVVVRNLTSGEAVLDAQRSFVINAVPGGGEQPGASSSAASSVSYSSIAAPPATGSTGGSSLLRLILTIAAVVIGALIIGAAGVWAVSALLKRQGGGTLQEKLESVESRLIQGKKQGDKNVIDVAPPMQIKKTEPTEVPTKEPIKPVSEPPVAAFTPAMPTPSPAEPKIDINEAPGWLKKGLDANKANELKATNMPATQTPPPPQTPPPAQPKAPLEREEDLPAWLKAPAPSTQPKTASTPPPPPPPPPQTPPSTKQTSPLNDENLPSWLKAPAPSPQATKPAPTPPAPAPLAPTNIEPPKAAPFAIVAPPAPPPPPPPVTPPPPPPAPAWKPQPEPQKPTVPPPVPPTAPQPGTSSITDEQQEKERERKRLKRQRYRQNLKRRHQEEQVEPSKEQQAPELSTPLPPIAAIDTAKTDITKEPITPKPEAKTPASLLATENLPNWLKPPVAEEKIAPPPAPQKPASTPPPAAALAAPEPKPQSTPPPATASNTAPLSADTTKKPNVVPPPVPAPIAKPEPEKKADAPTPAQPAPAPQAPQPIEKKDDDVLFVVEAQSLSGEQKDKPQGNTQ